MAAMEELPLHRSQRRRSRHTCFLLRKRENRLMFKIDRRLIQNFDWVTFATVIVIAVIGIMTVFSATRQPGEAAQSPLFIRQAMWLLVGLVGLVAFVSFDY